MKFTLIYFPAFLLLGTIISSCKKSTDYSRLQTVVSMYPGNTCSEGGISIRSGIDKNNNNQLDMQEIDKVEHVCNEKNDKQIITTLLSSGDAYYTGSFLNPRNIMCIKDFNIGDYPGVDSVVLYANERSNSSNGITSLYNFTDQAPVAMSEVISKQDNQEIHSSGNFFNSFPKRKIDIGFQITSVGEGSSNGASIVYMVMYRK